MLGVQRDFVVSSALMRMASWRIWTRRGFGIRSVTPGATPLLPSPLRTWQVGNRPTDSCEPHPDEPHQDRVLVLSSLWLEATRPTSGWPFYRSCCCGPRISEQKREIGAMFGCKSKLTNQSRAVGRLRPLCPVLTRLQWSPMVSSCVCPSESW